MCCKHEKATTQSGDCGVRLCHSFIGIWCKEVLLDWSIVSISKVYCQFSNSHKSYRINQRRHDKKYT